MSHRDSARLHRHWGLPDGTVSFGEGHNMRYIIVSDKYGVLLNYTTEGTHWSRNDGEHDTSGTDPALTAPTFTKEEGEAEIARLNENFHQDPMELVECGANAPPHNEGGPPRASRRDIAARGFIPG